MDAQQLVALLKERKLSQRTIAERCGLSQGAISHIETGRRKDVRASTKESLEKLFAEIEGSSPDAGEAS
jgi:transcriptional regulator with XRE-family HTH domain